MGVEETSEHPLAVGSDDNYSGVETIVAEAINSVLDAPSIKIITDFGSQNSDKDKQNIDFKSYLGINSLDTKNLVIEQLVEKPIDEDYNYQGLRIKFTNTSGEEVIKNISIIMDSDGSIEHIHISDPKKLNERDGVLNVRNLDNCKFSLGEDSKDRGVDVNTEDLDGIVAKMLEVFQKALDRGEEEVAKLFEESGILKGTLDSTFSFGEDIKGYFSHFCTMNPKLNVKQKNSRWLTKNKSILTDLSYIFEVGEENDRKEVNGNFSMVFKRVNNKWCLSILHSSLEYPFNS